MNAIEFLIGQMFEGIFFNPLLFGLFFIFLIFFIVMVTKMSLEAGVVVLIPALLWVIYQVPLLMPLKVLLGLGLGIIFAFMIVKLISR